MKITKLLMSFLLTAACLVGCASMSQPTTQLTQPTTQPVPTTTQPQTKPSEPTVPPTTRPAPTLPVVTEPPKKLAPDFTVYDAEGNEVKLSDYLGQPVVLNFWASWCFPCLSELPHFNKKSQEYEGQIQFLMVNCTAADKREDADAVIRNRGYVFPVFYDIDGNAVSAYQISGIPATYIIDAEGYIVEKVVGSLKEQDLQWLIHKLLPNA